jgi:hypothetical protein
VKLAHEDRSNTRQQKKTVNDTVAALDLRLDEQARTRFDGIFPGYRTAPEDYAR